MGDARPGFRPTLPIQKAEASAAKAEEQTKALQALEAEKAELVTKREELIKEQEAKATAHKEQQGDNDSQPNYSVYPPGQTQRYYCG